jgi:hypothetical protein
MHRLDLEVAIADYSKCADGEQFFAVATRVQLQVIIEHRFGGQGEDVAQRRLGSSEFQVVVDQ